MSSVDERKQKFITLFNEVFDSKGEIQKVGRAKCIALIEAANALDSCMYYGDTKYGFVNVDNLKTLRSWITD